MSDFIKRHKVRYKGLKTCHCPELGETICFNSMGFDHLLYKKGRPRSIKEVYSRLNLLKHVKTVIKKSNKAKFRRVGELLQCCLEYKIDGYIIKVIVQKRGWGSYIFLSIMRKRIK